MCGSIDSPARPTPWPAVAALLLGASGVIGQVILWCGLLPLYQGNELTTGIILANWLLAEAAGSWWGGRHSLEGSRATAAYSVMSILYAVALLATWVSLHLIRRGLGFALGEPVGPLFVLLTSLAVLALPSFLHGALFPVVGRLHAALHARAAGRSVGAVYIWESLGTLLGAVLVKLHYRRGGTGALLLIAVWLAAGFGLFTFPVSLAISARRLRLLAVGCGAIAIGLISFHPRLHRSLLARQFHPYPVVAHATSPLANWAVLAGDGQWIFAADGQPALMAPVPDRIEAQAIIHIPMLLHGSPRRVACLGGASIDWLEELLAHRTLESVDWVEADPALPGLLREVLPELWQRTLGDPRVNVRTADPRRFLRAAASRYDLLWVAIAEPVTLQENRLFTVEFFRCVQRRLDPGGLLVLAVPGRLAWPTRGRRHLHAGLHASLQAVFPHVRVLPADGRFLYLASPARDLANFGADEFQAELQRRGLGDRLALTWPLEHRLHEGWAPWFHDEYLRERVAPNRDLHPRALFHALADRHETHSPRLAAALGVLAHPPAAAGLVLLPAATLVTAALVPRRTASARVIGLQVATTGFTGMIMDLLVILAFQSALGYVHGWIGLLVAAYMIGAAVAAAGANRVDADGHRLRRLLRLADASLALFCALLPVALYGAVCLAARSAGAAIAGFLALNLLAGALTGFLFPLAAAWRVQHGDPVSRAAGALQTMDLLGGWLAGLFGSVLLIPLVGFAGAGLGLSGLKLLTYLLARIKV